MTRRGKIPAEAGIESRIFRFRGGLPNHKANEVVVFARFQAQSELQSDGHDNARRGWGDNKYDVAVCDNALFNYFFFFFYICIGQRN